MSTQYTAKIIKQLKQYHQIPINATDLLYFLNRLISTKQYPLHYVHKFITQNYPLEQIDWKSMDQQNIIDIHRQQLYFIERNQKQWKLEEQKLQMLSHQYIEQKKRIKKILKEKSLTKKQLIDTYLEQIRRKMTFLAKSSPLKTNQFSKTSNQTPQLSLKYNYERNIQLLQKRIAIMRDTKNFHLQNQDLTFDQTSDQFNLQEKLLNKLVEEFQFKKKYFEDLQLNSQLQEAFQFKKKLLVQTKNLNRRLKQLFLHYSNQNYDPKASFQKNNYNLIHIDLRLFLKYFKQLKQAHPTNYFEKDEKNQKKFKSNNLTLVFKKYAKNQKQISFMTFLKINYELFLQQENAFNNLTETQIFGDQKEQKKVLKNQSSEEFYREIQKLNLMKDIFFNQKVGKIINVYQRNQDIEAQSLMTQTNLNNLPIQGNQSAQKAIKNKKMGKFIDKTLEDYQLTRKTIHQTFLQRHRKETVQNFESRLNLKQKNTIKIIVSKNPESSKVPQNNQKNKISHQLKGASRFADFKNKTDFNIIYSNKNIFNQIINEVDEEKQEDDNIVVKNQQKSRSLANLLSEKNRARTFDPKKVYSSISSRKAATGSMKNIFSLPKITRLSQQQIENQSIIKTLSYLYKKLGKEEQPRIKKLLELDKAEPVIDSNKIQNDYLKEYFSKETDLENFKAKQMEQMRRNKKYQGLRQNCKKLKEQNFQKFFKFS